MAASTVPGLKGLGDAPSGTRERLSRVASPDPAESIGAPALRPSASPVDTYAHPEQDPASLDAYYSQPHQVRANYNPAAPSAPSPTPDYTTQALIQGLSQLNPALTRFGMTATEVMAEKQREELPDRYAKMAAGKTPEEARKAALEDPVLRTAAGQQYWGKLNVASQADQYAVEDQKWYETEFDKAHGDLDAELRARAAQRVKDLGLDSRSGAAGALFERLGASSIKLKQYHEKWKAEEQVQRQQQLTQDGILSQVRTAVDAGKPEEAASRVGEVLRTNKDLNRLPYKDQQKWLLDATERLVGDMERDPAKRDQTYAAIKSLLDEPRAGEDGVPRRLTEATGGVGEAAQASLAKALKKYHELNDRFGIESEAQLRIQAEYKPQELDLARLDKLTQDGTISPAQNKSIRVIQAHAIHKLGEQAADLDADRQAKQYQTNVDGQNFKSFMEGRFKPSDVQLPTKSMILEQGKGRDVEDYRRYTKDEATSTLVSNVQAEMDRRRVQLINQGYTPEVADAQVRATEMSLYSINQMAPPAWKEELQGGLRQATAAILSGQQPPAEVLSAYRRYRQVAENAPNLLPDVTTKETRSFYDMATTAAKYGYPDEQSQLLVAGQYFARLQKDPDKEAISRKTVRETVEKMQNGGFVSAIKDALGVEHLQNAGVMKDKIVEMATMFHFGMGLEPDAAIQEAMKGTKRSFAVVNGWAVDVNDKRLGPDFERRAERYLDHVFYQVGPQMGAQNRRDLVLVPMGEKSDAFVVLNKRNGNYLPPTQIDLPSGAKWDARFVTPQVLQEMDGLMRGKNELKAIRQSEGRLDPPLVLGEQTYAMPFRWGSIFGDKPAFTPAEEAEVARRAQRKAQEQNARSSAAARAAREPLP